MSETRTDRREFLKTAGAAAVGLSMGGLAMARKDSRRPKWYKALKIGMLPGALSLEDKCKLAKRCGFDGIDGIPIEDLTAAKQQAEVAKKAGCPFHGIVCGGWHAPLSDPNPKVIEKGMKGMETGLRCANAMGVDTVLLVPAVVSETVGYEEAYKRSQDNIRKLLPLAEEMKVVIAVENVWNKMLLGPFEYAQYIDELESPWVKAYFDIGNCIIQSFAQHWIRILKDRIVKLDVKDFKRPTAKEGYQWTDLLEGEVNWPEVRKALLEIGYEGWMTAELHGGNEEYLTEVASRMEKVVTGEL